MIHDIMGSIHEITPISLAKHGVKKIQFLCGEGFGRSQVGTESTRNAYPNIAKLIENPCGLRPAQSGRTTMVPEVATLTSKRYSADITGREPRLAEPSIFDIGTLVIAYISQTDTIHDFILKDSLGILVGYLSDPGVDVKNRLDPTADRIAFYTWLLSQAFSRLDEVVNIRDESGSLIPQEITGFLPEGMSYEEACAPFTGSIGNTILHDFNEVARRPDLTHLYRTDD